jgi:hypothetical protein
MQSQALLTVPQFAEKNRAWTQAALRALILNAEDRINSRGERIVGNGLSQAIVRLGRKVMIDEQAFFAWVAEQQERRKAAA